jgi:hypothetical protein
LQAAPQVAQFRESLKMLQNPIGMEVFDFRKTQAQRAISIRQLKLGATPGQHFIEVVSIHGHGAAIADRSYIGDSAVGAATKVTKDGYTEGHFRRWTRAPAIPASR